jgi:O-antigen ligase
VPKEVFHVFFHFMTSDRLRFCFESPIEAGIVIVGLCVWLFIPLLLRLGNRWLRAGIAFMLAVAVVCLALTGSRGPILAGFVSFVTVFVVAWRHGQTPRKALVAPCLTGILCLVFSLFIFPAGKRMGDMVGGGDGSVLNRLELWRAAGPMSFVRPLTGIGAGESGYFFSQWYQPERLNYSYTGLLNSYLEIAVERGIPVFAGVMAVGFLLVASAWFGIRNADFQVCSPSGKSRLGSLRYVSAAGIWAKPKGSIRELLIKICNEVHSFQIFEACKQTFSVDS